MIKRQLISAICCCALSVSTASGQSYPAGVDSLVSSVAALTAAAESEIGLVRSEERYRTIRKAVSDGVIATKGQPAPISVLLNAESLLCETRKEFVEIAARQNYLSAIGTEIKKTATGEPIDSLAKAITTLFKTYSVEVANNTGKLKDAKAKAFEICKKDLATYAADYYQYAFSGGTVGLEEIFSPFTSLFKTILDIVSPPIQAGAKILDEQKRKKAIRDFLQKEDTKEQIRISATKINSYITSALSERRHMKTGKFVDHVDAINATKIDLGKEPACQSAFTAAGTVRLKANTQTPEADFVRCMTYVWKTYSDQVAAMLKVADEYDRLADAPADLGGKKLKAITDKLDQIAAGTVPPANLKDLWTKAVEIVAFAQSVVSAASEENREKIQKQIDALVKVL